MLDSLRAATGPRRRRRAAKAAAAAFASGLTLTSLSLALAQTAKEDSVLGRPRPEFDPLGLELDEVFYRIGLLDKKTVEEKRSPLASFIVSPVNELETRYETNIFRTNRSVATPKSDEIAYIRPSLGISSDWNNHSVSLSVGGDISRHLHYPDEDATNVRAALNGRIDLHEDVVANLETKFEKLQEPRGTPDDLGPTLPPSIAQVLSIGGGLKYQTDLLLHLKVKIDHMSFTGGDVIATPLRDRTESLYAFRTGWEFMPGTTAFIEPQYNRRDYEHLVDTGGFRQGSHGYRFLTGLSWDASGVTFAEIGVGWMRQMFDEPLFEPVSGPSIEGKLIWNATNLMTITALLSRSIGETSVVGAAGVLNTSAGLVLDYELLDNLIFSARLDFAKSDFGGQDRHDSTVSGGVGLDYRIGHKWFARLGLDDTHKFSNVPNTSFEDKFISLHFGEHL